MHKRQLLILVCAVVPMLGISASPQKPKAILLSVNAEKEGPNGLWVQSGKDLSDAELTQFNRSLESSIKVMKDVQVVMVEDQRDHVEIVVSLVKVPRRGGGWSYAASSVLGIAKGKDDIFMSHNVIVCDDLDGVAKAIGFSFASLRLNAALGS